MVGAAVLILLGADRRRRAWAFVIPAALYGSWLLWSHNRFHGAGESVHLDNLLLAPNWAFNSMASSGESLVGLNYPLLGNGWGPPVALLAFLALGLRLWQGSISRYLWATIAVLGTLWLIGAAAAAPPFRLPESSRYLYPGAIAVLLVAVEAARGVPIQRRAMMILFAVAAMSVATNIALLRDGSRPARSRTPTDSSGSHRRRARPRTSWRHLPDRLRAACRAPQDRRGRHGHRVPRGGEAVRLTGLLAAGASRTGRAGTGAKSTLPSPTPTTSACVRRALRRGNARQAGEPRTSGTLHASSGRRGAQVERSCGSAGARRFGSAFKVQAGQLVPGQWMALSVPRDCGAGSLVRVHFGHAVAGLRSPA